MNNNNNNSHLKQTSTAKLKQQLTIKSLGGQTSIEANQSAYNKNLNRLAAVNGNPQIVSAAMEKALTSCQNSSAATHKGGESLLLPLPENSRQLPQVVATHGPKTQISPRVGELSKTGSSYIKGSFKKESFLSSRAKE